MSIASPALLQRFSRIKREGTLPSCLVHTGLASQAKHLVKVGVGKASRELSNSQESQMVDLKHIFLLNLEVFSVFFNFYTDF